MSFLGGAECSTAGNPLSQFTKHVQDDKSLQRDRLVGNGSSGAQESFRSPRNGPGQDEVSIVPINAVSSWCAQGSIERVSVLTMSYR